MEKNNLPYQTFLARAMQKSLCVFFFNRMFYGLKEPCCMVAEVHHYMWDATEHLDKVLV